MIYEQFLALTEADEPAKAGFWKGLKEKGAKAGAVIKNKAAQWSGARDLAKSKALKQRAEKIKLNSANLNGAARDRALKNIENKLHASKIARNRGLKKAGITGAAVAGVTAGGIALGSHLKKKKSGKKD